MTAVLEDTFAALADPTRRKVIDALKKEPLRAGELAELLELSAPAMSRHLRVLRHSGLVEENDLPHDARVRLYRLKPEAFVQLRDWLDEVQAFWTDQLSAFAAHAEKTRGKKKK